MLTLNPTPTTREIREALAGDGLNLGPIPVDVDKIRARAHQLWIERGCPEGSPDADWYRAESELEQR